MKVYKSTVSAITYLLFFSVAAILIIPIFLVEQVSTDDFKDLSFLAFLGFIVVLLFGLSRILFSTRYTIKDGLLYHRSGPFHGKMKISSITKIIYHSGLYVPVLYRPATDSIGVIIVYNKYDDIYFSPEQRDVFVADLLKINPEIEVVKSEKQIGSKTEKP